MHAGLAGLRCVSPPGHLQAVGERSRVARRQRGGGAISGAAAEQPVRSRGAFCDEHSSAEPSWTAPGHRPRRLATGGRSAARRAGRDNSSVRRRVARCGAGQPRECGAAAGIGGGCEQVRGSCAPLLRLMRRAVRRQGTHQVPAPAPKWRPASPAGLRAQRSHPPTPRPLLRPTRRSLRRQGTHQVPTSPPKWRPASPAGLRAQRSHPPTPRPLLRPTRRSKSAVRGHTKCPPTCRRRSGDRRARHASARIGSHPTRPADANCGRRSSGGRARSSAACAGAIQQCHGRRLRRRSSGGRARSSATSAGAIQQCRGRRLRRRSSGGRARSSAPSAGAIQQCRGRRLRRRSSGGRARSSAACAGAIQQYAAGAD